MHGKTRTSSCEGNKYFCMVRMQSAFGNYLWIKKLIAKAVKNSVNTNTPVFETRLSWRFLMNYSIVCNSSATFEGFWRIIELFVIFLVYLLRQCKYFISNHFLWYQIFLKIDSFFDHLPILISYSDTLFIYLCTKDFQFGENMLSASRATFIFF